ncbi:alpha/beta hydrolase family protein [Rudaeicoccus suwonensis]|uniref:AB hydrolase-1 domain-containing protein n=1 Tax=Rudaeicoccus suwonensis TaxID=657409 RepID=A0A561EBE5_9MICO|nr:alpha/beta fold hydrolase [Rudaeicoccus suwonensis]TWE12928.1 hypothetical protein BKA23_1755 [Rudaeicoccus suwonensis]
MTATLGAAVTTGLASYFVRRVITPDTPVDDLTVVAVTSDAITLTATAESTEPGRYGLWQNGFQTHARLGEVLTADEHHVVRRIDGIDRGILRPGPARLNGYYFCGPPTTSPGLDLHEVMIDGAAGPMPAWCGQVPGDRWAVLVHGRGALRAEGLRAVPTLQRLGISCLLPSYRNDVDAPASEDRLYHLGLTEWQDIEAAIRYAADHGAREVQLFGWSMGGAVVLQTLDRSALAAHVSRVVLDAPVLDWQRVMDFHAKQNRLPRRVGRYGQWMLRSPARGPLTGVADVVDVRETDWLTKAVQLTTPTLVIHSRVDEFVPYEPSALLAQTRPDLVQLATWESGRHCREWNVDSQRWEDLVADFCGPPQPPVHAAPVSPGSANDR